MYKNIFTLGLILTSIYTATAIAADNWPTLATKKADKVWTDPAHSIEATLHCADCCQQGCWLPTLLTGQYYDASGSFTENCNDEFLATHKPSCDPNATAYELDSNNKCIINSCKPGYWVHVETDPKISITCTLCPEGEYCTGGTDVPHYCTNAPAHSHYTGTGTTGNNCPWACDNGYHQNGTACDANKYTIKFDANGGNGNINPITFDYGSTQLPWCNTNFTKYGSKCTKWGIKSGTTINTIYPEGLTITMSNVTCKDNKTLTFNIGTTEIETSVQQCDPHQNSEFTLYAIWECDTGYKLSSDSTECICDSNICQGTCNEGEYDIGNGAQMCANPTTNGEIQAENPREQTYSVKFKYGTITGSASCENYYMDSQYATSGAWHPTDISQYCWCSMTTPYPSDKVYYQDMGSACTASSCLTACATAVAQDENMREAMYTHLIKE